MAAIENPQERERALKQINDNFKITIRDRKYDAYPGLTFYMNGIKYMVLVTSPMAIYCIDEDLVLFKWSWQKWSKLVILKPPTQSLWCRKAKWLTIKIKKIIKLNKNKLAKVRRTPWTKVKRTPVPKSQFGSQTASSSEIVRRNPMVDFPWED